MVNRAIILGNLTRDVEVSHTTNGNTVAKLGVATNRSWKDKDGNKKDEVEYHSVVVWGSTAEFCGNYLRKGSKVYIEGRIQSRKYQASDGGERSVTEIIAQTVQNLTPRQDSRQDSGDGYSRPGVQSSSEQDLPF